VSVLLLLAASVVYAEQRSRAGRLGQVAYAVVAVSLVVSVFTGLGVVASYFLAGTDSQVFDLFHSAEAIPYVAVLLGMPLFGIATIRSRTFQPLLRSCCSSVRSGGRLPPFWQASPGCGWA
jgi:hypothetical protein